MTTAKIAEIKKVLELATPGPWESFNNGPWGGQGAGVAIGKDPAGWPIFGKHTEQPHIANSFLCAGAREWLPELISDYEKALARTEKLGRALAELIGNVLAGCNGERELTMDDAFRAQQSLSELDGVELH